MSVQMDERFTAALRDLLVEQVRNTGTRRSRWRWPQRWGARIGLIATVLCGGGGIAAATTELVLSSGGSGGEKIVELAAPVSVTGDGTQTVQLGQRPAGANAIYMYLSCLTPGTFSWGADPSGPRMVCGTARDAADSAVHPMQGSQSLAPGQHSITVTAAPGERWRLTASYVTATTTPWKVNANGQTYGTPNQNGTPDLIAAIATNHRAGYVYANQLEGPQPTTPAQAATWAQTHPGPRTITVYKSDGKTPIGVFISGTGGTACMGTTACPPPPAGTATTLAATTTTDTSP